MTHTLKLLGILSALTLTTWGTPTAQADNTSFNFRGASAGGAARGGNGGARPAPQPTSNQQQFFNQSSAQQQSFFAQPVFPHSNFSQTQSVQPAFVPPSVIRQQVWVSPPVNYYLPPQFYSSYQPGFYVAPTVYGNGPAYFVPATRVFTTQQPVNSYSAPQQRMTFGLIDRW